ncbi:MAG: DMSO reductase [Desulfobacteraceae bacterium]|nr:DMSO reductase [Desulfobacteraceae bacterium]
MMKQRNELEKIMFHPTGSDLKPYEWMLNATPQLEWIDKKGIFLLLAFFFTEIGAGLYFISLFYEYTSGLILGWLIALILGGGIHVLYLGNPFRAWRMLMKPQTSELSRGMWIIGIFAFIGFIQMVTGNFSPAFNVIMGILALLIVSHGFMTMNVVRALAAWSSTMVIPLSIISGVWIGCQIFQFMLAVSGNPIGQSFEIWSQILLVVYFVSVLLYLWGTYHASETAKESINLMLKGSLSKYFYTGVVLVGFFLPLLITLKMWGSDINAGLIFIRLALVFAGDIAMRYIIMKSAMYQPLI